MSNVKLSNDLSKPQSIPMSEFLMNWAPGNFIEVSDLMKMVDRRGSDVWVFNFPDIKIYCNNELCNGERIYRCKNFVEELFNVEDIEDENSYLLVAYVCSNCRETKKIFALAAYTEDERKSGKCYKFGELPNFDSLIPSKLISMIGPDKDLFIKGKRCENQGLGVGAFAYYRRVVENQKNRIFDEVIRALIRINASPNAIQKIENAKSETQFSTAIDSIKDVIPDALLIENHNPLTLLHKALSIGLHNHTDQECLALAHDIRTVLTKFSEKIAEVLKEDRNLDIALSRLMRANNQN